MLSLDSFEVCIQFLEMRPNKIILETIFFRKVHLVTKKQQQFGVGFSPQSGWWMLEARSGSCELAGFGVFLLSLGGLTP